MIDPEKCDHFNKVMTDGFNMDGEVYYECSDCGSGWRQEPDSKEDEENGLNTVLYDLAVLERLESEERIN